MKTTLILTALAMISAVNIDTSYATNKTDKPTERHKEISKEERQKALQEFKDAKKKNIDSLKLVCSKTNVVELKKMCPSLMQCEIAERPDRKTSDKCQTLFNKEQALYDRLAREGKSSKNAGDILFTMPRDRKANYKDYYTLYIDIYGYDTFYVDDNTYYEEYAFKNEGDGFYDDEAVADEDVYYEDEDVGDDHDYAEDDGYYDEEYADDDGYDEEYADDDDYYDEDLADDEDYGDDNGDDYGDDDGGDDE